ncbi:MAG: DNA polymerase IV [Candidatus Ornithomonoglobus sp.]
MDRTILHVDANCFFASVECAMNPKIADKPVAVVGDVEKRHGIVLTANYAAKRGFGVKTGDIVWQAKGKCPDLIVVKARHDIYMRFSHLMREILCSYSDYVEPFGCDEAWVELRGMLAGHGMEAAENIRQRIKAELGITVSIGVSFNKIFAKLGSDMKKTDAVTEITRENFKEKVWRLPVEDLLYVGPQTKAKLNNRAIYTIGDLARADAGLVQSWLGKNGLMLHDFANGRDVSRVAEYDELREFKSVGNSTTCPRDLVNEDEVKTVLITIADSVAERLRSRGCRGREITVSIRDNELHWITHRCTLDYYTNTSAEIAACAEKLFREIYGWINPVRGLGISVSGLIEGEQYIQLDVFGEAERRCKRESLSRAGDIIKSRFGKRAVLKARQLCHSELCE